MNKKIYLITNTDYNLENYPEFIGIVSQWDYLMCDTVEITELGYKIYKFWQAVDEVIHKLSYIPGLGWIGNELTFRFCQWANRYDGGEE